MRYTIRWHGAIMGTYAGANEQEALDALAKEKGCANHAEAVQKFKLSPKDVTTESVLPDQ